MTESSSFSFRSADDLLILCREMLGHPPTQESWLSVCHAIEACRSTLRRPSELQVAIDYLQGHVGHWKASQRRPLYRWWEKHQEAELDPVWALVGEPKMWLWDEGAQPGEVRTYPLLPHANVVWCPPGSFMMGASEMDEQARSSERPAHEVCISRGFWMVQSSVTQKQFEEHMWLNPSEHVHPDCPVNIVSWFDAISFANILTENEGLEVNMCAQKLKDGLFSTCGARYARFSEWRLPTEAEWEYACKSGRSTVESHIEPDYSSTEKLERSCWYVRNSERRAWPIMQKEPNLWGLSDMCGNVWEWVFDAYSMHAYTCERRIDPLNSSALVHRVIRGGGWFSHAHEVRASYRSFESCESTRSDLGFRLVFTGQSIERWRARAPF